MKLATWNVNSLKVRLPQVLQWLTSILSWPLVARFCAAIQRRLAATAPSWWGG
jgi:exonuclease III